MPTCRRLARAVAALLALLAGVAVAAPLAEAAVITFDYVLASSDPLTDGPCGPAPSATFHYTTATVSVDVTGDYVFEDQLGEPGVEDGYIGFYAGAFDPADPAARCLDVVDDDGTLTFTAGTTYVGVLSSFVQFDTGTFRYQVDGPGTLQVGAFTPFTSSTVVAAVPNPSLPGQGVTLTATVSSPAGGTPTGTVTFFDGTTSLGVAPLVAGVATLPATFTDAGVHSLTAVYGASAFYLGSTSEIVTQVVGSTATTVVVPTTPPATSAPAPCPTTADIGAASSTTETPAPTDEILGGPAPTDEPTATDEPTTTDVPAGTDELDTTDEEAATSPTEEPATTDEPGTPRPVGLRRTAPVVALAEPCPTTTSSSPPVVAATVTTLSSSANPSTLGQPVTFTTTISVNTGGALGWRRGIAPSQVSPDGGMLTISDGDTVLGTVAVVDGRAAFTTSSLTAGAHTINAAFSGTATTAASSATIVQQVDLPPAASQPSRPVTRPAVLPATR